MTARLLSARYGELWGPTGWVTMLRCCAAYEAYLRTYQRAVDGSLAAEFLLLDRLFPRSVFHALPHRRGVPRRARPRASSRTGMADDARRILGRARTELEFHTTDELLADLPAPAPRHPDARRPARASAVADRYFRQTRALVWRHEPRSVGAEPPRLVAGAHQAPHGRSPTSPRSQPRTTRPASRRRRSTASSSITSRIDVKPTTPARLLHRLLGHGRPRLRRADVAHRALGHVDLAGRHRPARRRGRRRRLGRAGRRRR